MYVMFSTKRTECTQPMAKCPQEPEDAQTVELLEQKLRALVRALAIRAAREDHLEMMKQMSRNKGGRPRKIRLQGERNKPQGGS